MVIEGDFRVVGKSLPARDPHEAALVSPNLTSSEVAGPEIYWNKEQ